MSNDPNGEFPKNTKMAVTVHTPPNVLTSETAESARATYRMLLTRTDELARALGNMLEAYDVMSTGIVLNDIHVAEARKLYADYLAAGIRAK